MEILSPEQVKRAGFTCDDCPDPFYDQEDDVVYFGYNPNTMRRRSKNLKYPERCRACDTHYRSYKRMRKRLDKIWDISYEKGGRYSRPKLITFALPSMVTFESDPETELKKLNDLLPKARTVLFEHGVLGGTYVPECTTRSYEVMGVKSYKHHAHVHMVALSPFIPRKELKVWCEQLLTIGLGRINYEAPKGNWRDAKKRVASYISKYLVKDGRSSRTWGIMRISNHTDPKQ